MQRREFMAVAVAAAAAMSAASPTDAAVASTGTAAGSARPAAKPRAYKRIATEEGWLSEGVLAANERYAARNTGIQVMTRSRAPKWMVDACADIGAGRIATMDRDGIDMQLLLLSSPGVQVFSPEEGSALARDANDQLADAIRAHPTRFAGLAAVAPQDPAGAVREMQRAVTQLHLNGVIINSHTNNEYLSGQKYWPILEAAEALGTPIYVHPREPAATLAAANVPEVSAAGWAYGTEVGTHVMHMIGAGVFDRFPKLKIVIGHMGEAIPNWLPRIDNRYLTGPRPLKRLPSEYVLNNIWVTTSGMNYEPQLLMTINVMGIERVLYAVDYPFEEQGEAVRMLEAMHLTEAQKKLFCEDNARRLFGIKA